MRKKRNSGQSSLEYGVFFAFALMIGLMIISVLSEFSIFGSEGDLRKGHAYWYSKKPIGIEDLVYYDDGTVVVALRNKDVENLYVENLTTEQGVISIKQSINSGDAMVYNDTDFPTCNATSLELVRLSNITIYYKRPGAGSFFAESGRESYYTHCIKAPESTSSSTGGGGGGGCSSPFIYFLLVIAYYAYGKRKEPKISF